RRECRHTAFQSQIRGAVWANGGGGQTHWLESFLPQGALAGGGKVGGRAMNAYLSTVNQKLLFARLLAKDMERAGANPHGQRALLESMVFQLRLAYHFHLQEIAANYQCRQPNRV